MLDNSLLILIEDFSNYNDDKIIFFIPNMNESKATLGFIMAKLLKDQINHRDRITNKTRFFYIANEDVQTGLYNGEFLDTILYPLNGNGIYKVYRILADNNGNLYMQWAQSINANTYIPPYEYTANILTEINNS